MEAGRLKRIKKSTHINLAAEANETLKKIEEDFPDNPESMGYFYDIFRKTFNNGISLATNKKIIGTTCTQVPEELIYASDAIPLRLCNGAHTFNEIGAEFMPAKSCSLVKATMGMLHIFQNIYQHKLNMVVIPTTCDQKKKAGEMLEEMGFYIYAMEVPSIKDTEEARFYWQNSVKKLVLALQKVTGKRITKKRVNDAIRKINKARLQYRRLYNLRESSPSVIYGKDAFLVTNAYFIDDIDRWIHAVTILNDELEKKKMKGEFVGNKQFPRILFTGSPPLFPNLKLLLLVEKAGAIVVTDEVCSSSRVLYDTIAYDEENLYDMIPAIADRYLKPCICPFLIPNNDRKRKLIEMAKRFDIDGVVYQSYSGCHLYQMEYGGIAQALMNEGIPMLYIETDYSPEDIEQLRTRIEAFLEIIKGRRESKVTR